MSIERKLAAALGALELEDAAIRRLEATIQRVRALHAPFNSYCSGCIDPYCKGETVVCGECGESSYPYPCDTIKALDGDQS